MKNDGLFGMILVSKFSEHGFLTGSRAFGNFREYSDWDIAYSMSSKENIGKIIKEYGLEVKPSEYFSGIKIKCGDTNLNLIPLQVNDYTPWYLATKAMTSTLSTSGISNRTDIHAIFMAFVCAFKGRVKPSLYKKSHAYNGI